MRPAERHVEDGLAYFNPRVVDHYFSSDGSRTKTDTFWFGSTQHLHRDFEFPMEKGRVGEPDFLPEGSTALPDVIDQSSLRLHLPWVLGLFLMQTARALALWLNCCWQVGW